MSDSGVPSPSGSAGGACSSRPCSSRSLRSNTSSSSNRLSDLVQDCVIPTKMTVLSDVCNVDQPTNKSWPKKLDDTSKEMMDNMLHENNEPNDNVDMENNLDIDIEWKMDQMSIISNIDNSDTESIQSLVVPHRKLFASKKRILPDSFQKFLKATLNDTSPHDDSLFVVPNKLFNKPNQKKKKSTENVLPDKPKNIFRKLKIPIKKMFPDKQFSKSKDVRGEIHPKVFRIIKTEDEHEKTNDRQQEIEPLNMDSQSDIENNQNDMTESQSEIENEQDDMNESNPEIDDEIEKFNTSQQELEDKEADMMENQSKFRDDQDELKENQSEFKNNHDEINKSQLKIRNIQEELGEGQHQGDEENLKQNRKRQQKKNLDEIEETEVDSVASEPESQERHDYDEQ